MDAGDLLRGLDREQIAAITEASSPLAIIAAAGSGKTTVLTRRIAHRVLTDTSVSASHVLALTFTRQAARELQRRLRALGMRDSVEAGTFHAIALRLLRQRAVDRGHPVPSIASDRVRLMHDALRATSSGSAADGLVTREGAAALLAEIDWCRARRISAVDSLALRRAGRRTMIAPQRLVAAAEAYATIKRRRGVADFDDLLEQCIHLLATDTLWAEGVRWRFRHLFVDEAQDLNPLQHELLEAIRGERNDLCIVGDPRQAIFGFNGADPEIMGSIEDLYPGITIARLRHNHRCSPQILRAGVKILGNIGQRDDSVATSVDAAAVRVLAHRDDADEAAAVARILRDLNGAQRPWRSCAVLTRTVAQLHEIARALAAAGIPTTLPGRSGLSSPFAAALAEAFAARNLADLATWIEAVSADPSADPVRARVAEAADRFLAQGTGLTFRGWVQLHSPFDDLEQAAAGPSEDAVELSTFHGAKGREWPFVLVAGVETGLVPHASAVTVAQRAEEAHLLYVACTRARERLVLSWAGARHGRPARPSPLLVDVGADAVDAVIPPLIPRPPRERADPVLTALMSWRRNAARAAQVDPSTICSDDALRAVAAARPRSARAVAGLTDLGPLHAARIAPRLLAVLDEVTRDQTPQRSAGVGRAGAPPGPPSPPH